MIVSTRFHEYRTKILDFFTNGQFLNMDLFYDSDLMFKITLLYLFRNQMPKEVLVILWDQTTAQIFPVHRVLSASMAALPMNLKTRIITRTARLKLLVKKERKKQGFSRPRSHFLCNLGL